MDGQAAQSQLAQPPNFKVIYIYTGGARSGFASTSGQDLHLQQFRIYIYIGGTRTRFTST
eukprot:4601791-Amphidinium_carterae.1